MAEVIKVQSDWPLPAINRAPKQCKYPIETMKVGEMFFIPGRSSKSMGAYISRMSKPLTGKKFTTRHAWAAQRQNGSWHEVPATHKGAVEGAGVWRIE